MSELTTTTLLGLEVPVKPTEEYREHTAERWKEKDRESYDFALYLVRELGLTNKTKIVACVDEHRAARGVSSVSRNSVIALLNGPEFKPGEIDEIIKRRSLLTTADALDKIEELLERAKAAKDLGAAAMALTAVYNVKQLSNGAATRITGKTEGDERKSFDRYLERARKKLEDAHGTIIDITPPAAVPIPAAKENDPDETTPDLTTK
jgi:hypothetical protein